MIENLRQYRIGPYAIFDLVVSFLGVYLLSPCLTKFFQYLRVDVPKHNWLYLTLPIGILAHLMVGNRTQMTRDFLDPTGNYPIKILIVGLTIAGLWGVKIVK